MEQANASYYAVIPATIRYDPDLPPNAKLLYGELTSLASSSGYCWASNKYFAELYGLSQSSVSRLITQLADKGYIRCEMAATAKGSERRIYAGVFVVEPGGMRKNEEAPLRKNAKGGIRKNAKPLEENTKQGMVNEEDPPYIPPEGDGPAEGLHTPEPPEPPPEPKPRKRPPKDYRPEWFDAFWAIYPRKDGKQAAYKAWCKLRPDRAACAAMAAGLERARTSRQWTKDDGEFIPHASTWINGRMWEDEGVDLSLLPAASDSGGRRWAPDPEVIPDG